MREEGRREEEGGREGGEQCQNYVDLIYMITYVFFQLILSCSYYAEHPGRSLLAGNDSLALSRLRVRNLLLTSRTPPFDLIGWWYVSQSSHVDT